jgi:hypothetical protein
VALEEPEVLHEEGPRLTFMGVGVTMDLGDKEAGVAVNRIFKDGSTITRDTRFVYEKGWWRHHLTEEKRIFLPDASYEEFVKAL